MPGTAVGIDRGVRLAVVTNSGDFYDRKFATEGERERHRRLQRKAGRRKRGSANRRKALSEMNRLTVRVTNRRTDFCSQTARYIAVRNAVVILEDLKTKSVTTSAKGTLADPGTKVAQKRGLNRAILAKGWHRLELALVSAARYTGTQLIKVDLAYTSQTCNRCGHVDANNRESQATGPLGISWPQPRGGSQALVVDPVVASAMTECGSARPGRTSTE